MNLILIQIIITHTVIKLPLLIKTRNEIGDCHKT